MKYYLTLKYKDIENRGKYNAFSKAKADIIKTLEDLNWKPLVLNWTKREINFNKGYETRVMKFFLIVKMLLLSFKVNREDIILIQYPDYRHVDNYILSPLSRKGIRIIIIIHDLDFLRYPWYEKTIELSTINKANYILVHNNGMKSLLIKEGISSKKMTPITLFDYYSNDIINKEIAHSSNKVIAFAGNLEKSEFIKILPEVVEGTDIRIKLYGKFYEGIHLSNNVRYVTQFSPDNTGILEADWGLVWDGDSCSTCNGAIGEYLKYNTSHKISLYLTCGIPIIIWSGAYMSQWISNNKLGIALDSLYQLNEVLSAFSENDYREIVINCRKVASKLRQGFFLKEALSSITI